MREKGKLNEKNKNSLEEKNIQGTAGPFRTGSNGKETKKEMKDGDKWERLKKENPLVLIDDLQRENGALKKQLQLQDQHLRSVSMQLQRLITRVNRLEMYQNDMDVYLRNHQHKQQGVDLEELR